MENKTQLCITTNSNHRGTDSNHEVCFYVPTEWLVNYADKYHGWTLEQLLSEYTSDESMEIYSDAILDGVIDTNGMERCESCGNLIDFEECDYGHYWTWDGDRVVYPVCYICDEAAEEINYNE